MTLATLRKRAAGLLTVTLMFASASASAALFQGTLTFSGDIAIDDGDSLATTDVLRFIGNDFDVDSADGDFIGAGVLQGDFGTIADFDFALLDAAAPGLAIAGLDFALQEISVIAQTGSFLLLTGSGVISGNGFDDTSALFSLSANTSGHLNVYSGSLTAVPVPGALWLMGSALVALGMRRRNA